MSRKLKSQPGSSRQTVAGLMQRIPKSLIWRVGLVRELQDFSPWQLTAKTAIQETALATRYRTRGRRNTVMTMTDPIADMLTRIRNANIVSHEVVEMPSSKLKVELAKVLKEEGYITDYTEKEVGKFKVLSITLKYDETHKPVISNLKRISKTGLRVYSKAKDLPQVFGGLGIAIISTSKGLMTDRKARKEKLGGEVICYVW